MSERPEYCREVTSPESLAGYLGTVENGQSFGSLSGDRGVGTFGGSEDHTAILCCMPHQFSQYSFCPVEFRRRVSLSRRLGPGHRLQRRIRREDRRCTRKDTTACRA